MFSLKTGSELAEVYRDYLKMSGFGNDTRRQGLFANAFDAVWTAALALNNSVSKLPPGKGLEDFSYHDSEMAHIFYEEIKKLSFYGASVSVHFY